MWTSCFFSFCNGGGGGGKIGIFLPIELFNGKSMGNKSSITKGSIIPYSPIIIIMRNLFVIIIYSLSASMGNLQNSTVSISHIIPIDKEDQGNVALLWHRYGRTYSHSSPI